VLEGHTRSVNGALALPDGRLLSWSDDHTLRLWDGASGACLAVLEGHTEWVNGALALADGRLLSWSESIFSEKPLRLWDGQSGACLAVLEGPAYGIKGALALADGRLLSWGKDGNLRLWDGTSGACLAVLKGHTEWVNGALALADGRLLSWADTEHTLADNNLRLWDGTSGVCLAVIEGHTDKVKGALALADGSLLSWSKDKTLRLWDGTSGACLEVVPEDQAARRHPEWLDARRKAQNPESVAGDFFVEASARSARLRHKTIAPIIADWNAESDSDARYLRPAGTAVVTQANGQVCFLKLYYGKDRITLAEAEAFLQDLPKKSA
jgi:WD40 repeat protein